MKSVFLKLLCAGLLLFGVSFAYAAPVFLNGDSISLTIFGAPDTTYNSSSSGPGVVDNATVGASEFTVCFFVGAGDCSTGLQIVIDLHDSVVDLGITGGTGAAGQFRFEIGDIDFDPAANIATVTPPGYGLAGGGQIAQTPSSNSIQFTGTSETDTTIAHRGTVTFVVTTDAAVPEPGTLLLLGLALAGAASIRRRAS